VNHTLKATLLFLVLLTSLESSLYAATTKLHKTIIVGSYLILEDASAQRDSFERWALQNKRIKMLQEQEHFFFVTRKSGAYDVVALEPIEDENVLEELYLLVRPHYEDAFISKIRSNTLLELYGKGIAPDKIKRDQDELQKAQEVINTVDKKNGTTTQVVIIKDEPEEVIAPVVTQEIPSDEASSSNGALYIGVVLFLIFSLTLYLLIRSKKVKKHIQEVEEKNVLLEDDNSDLSNENEELTETITENNEFLEDLSDKLKHPTKQILGKTKKIMQTDLNDKQSIELRNIQDSGQALFAIVDDLLDFMKIRSHKLEIETKPFDINELLDLIVHSVVERIEKKDVEVIFDIETSVPPRIIGDPIRIGQVLTNLLENGIKFTNAGEVKLHVKRLSRDDEQLQLMFEVIDTGVGIPESKLDDIFTPFYQIHNSNAAGLGLSISKALVEMMGGEIMISTEPNKGSTFTFVLKLEKHNAEEKRHYRLPDKAYKSRRILIIDYHDAAAITLKKLLGYFHNSVDIIPQANIEKMAPNFDSYEIIFISEKLLNFALIKAIGKIKESSGVKIVVIGSMLHKPQHSNVVEKLADRHIMKPINQKNVFDTLVSFYGDVENIELPPEENTRGSFGVMPRIVIERTQKQNVTKEDFRSFEGASILVAEDNVINQKVLKSLLKDSGIAVDMAENGKIALKMAHEKKYDLLLMDINMPVMNGYEATARLKVIDDVKDIPIVALTGNTMPEEIAEMQACGMDDRIEKPIRIQALYSVFSKYLEFHPHAKDEVTALPNVLINEEDALERMGGDRDLYVELIEEFVKLYGNSGETLEIYYQDKKATLFKELTLDIKGVSANIGVYALSNAAKRLNESSLSSTAMPSFITTYQDELRKALTALQKIKSS